MEIDNITTIKGSIINRKSYTYRFNPVFFMLLAEKSPEIFPKHKAYFFFFYFRVFFFELIYFYSINK